jgi:hypothetical protein
MSLKGLAFFKWGLAFFKWKTVAKVFSTSASKEMRAQEREQEQEQAREQDEHYEPTREELREAERNLGRFRQPTNTQKLQREHARKRARQISLARHATYGAVVAGRLEYPKQQDVPHPPPGKLMRVCEHGGSLLPQPSPEVHAELFLKWVWGHEFFRNKMILAADLEGMYHDWCYALGWVAHNWSRVAKYLAPRMGGRRKYILYDGHKVRVYEVPHAAR